MGLFDIFKSFYFIDFSSFYSKIVAYYGFEPDWTSNRKKTDSDQL